MSEDARELYDPNPEISPDTYRKDLLQQFEFIRSRMENSEAHSTDNDVLLPEQVEYPGKRLKLSFQSETGSGAEDESGHRFTLSEVDVKQIRVGKLLAEGYKVTVSGRSVDEMLETYTNDPKELFLRFNHALTGSNFKQVMV